MDSNISQIERVDSFSRRFILSEEHRLGIRGRFEFQLCHKLCDTGKYGNSEYPFPY